MQPMTEPTASDPIAPPPDIAPAAAPVATTSDVSPAAAPAVPPRRSPSGDTGSRAVAALLAVAAILAALIGARASLLGSDATSAWADVVVMEQKRSALLLGDVRSIYGGAANEALIIEAERVLAEALRAAIPSAAPEIAVRLENEARIHDGVLQLMTTGTFSSELTSDPRYRLASGGFDLAGLLADRRAADAETIGIDPDARLADGDEAFRRQVALTALGILIGAAFLAGALAQAFRSRRRVLLAIGWLAVAAAAIPALTMGLP
jgi:hypothetical protein